MLLKDLGPFLDCYLESTLTKIPDGYHEPLRKFIKTLHLSQVSKWRKFNFLFTNMEGKGSWIGIYFRKKTDSEGEFYSNLINCAFKLMPDVFVLREEQSSRFLGFKQTDTSYYVVEKNRGFTREDLACILNVCEGLSFTKAISHQ